MLASTEQLDKITGSLMKACADMNIMMRDTMDAALQSMTILTKGCEEIGDSVSTLMQKSLENASQAGHAVMGIKNVNDLMDVHASLTKNGFDSVMAETNKLTQLSSRIVQQAAEPVTQNMNAAITKLALVKAA